ncbi:LysR substrate-binding domain-containing protein, partial [Amylibacter sp.]|nr:LysR substrate-binding domain-containing protein [Amylibacter sp.]
ELFLRRSKPLKLSKAGHKLLELAEKILPQVSELEEDFAGLISGLGGRLHIAIECHACFEWLFPVLENFRKNWPDIDIDIKPGLSFDALPALQREEVDIVISSDPEELKDVVFKPLFEYTPTFVCAENHPYAQKEYIDAEDFRDQTLITYPVDKNRLDIFSQLLTPAHVEPAAIRQAELTAVIILLVASGRGISVLPDWVVKDQKYKHNFVTKPVTVNGLSRKLYAAIRQSEAETPFMKDFVSLTTKQRI